jgi:hypothetical protein
MTINGFKINEEKRQRCLVITRVMGYHQAKERFNEGKLSEANKRTLLDEKTMFNSADKRLNAA